MEIVFKSIGENNNKPHLKFCKGKANNNLVRGKRKDQKGRGTKFKKNSRKTEEKNRRISLDTG